jgi:hypothetical protein
MAMAYSTVGSEMLLLLSLLLPLHPLPKLLETLKLIPLAVATSSVGREMDPLLLLLLHRLPL